MENKEKRKNFTPLELEVLLELVVKYQSIVENKLTNAVLNKQKSQAWNKIAEEFNRTPGTTKRSARQLLDCHRNFKSKAQRASLTEEKMLQFKTGEGPIVPTISPFQERVIAVDMTKQMLINAVDGDVSESVMSPGETIVPTADFPSLIESEESQEVVENIPLASTINFPPPPGTPVIESPKVGSSRNVQDHNSRQWRPPQKKWRTCASVSWEKALDERRKDEIKESELRLQFLEERHREEQRRLEEKHKEEQRRLEEIHQIELQLLEKKKWLLDLQIAKLEKTGK